ncbi:MAG: phosphohistidine-like domain-containing protein [bacterium]
MREHIERVGAEYAERIPAQLTRTGSLVDHYCICHDILNAPDIDTHMLAWVFVYMRLFSIKDMRKDMRGYYQTKDISHIQNELSMALARVYVKALSCPDRDTSFDRVLIRNIMNLTPRGGGNGDELRLFILDMMRRHGIREGHRPGIDDPFIEEWHQKLHSCCTPEDIGICEAYILFQETNSSDLFYKMLWERNGISVDYLRHMPRPLTHAPRYMPQLIPDLKHLLWILKQVHGGSSNFHYLLEVSKWQLDKELHSMLQDVNNHYGEWWIPGRIVDCRQRLRLLLRNHCPRDPLMIDVALDNRYKTAVERIDLRTLSGDDLVALVLLSLRNIHLSYENETIAACIDLWNRLNSVPDRDTWSREWALQTVAALNYIQSAVHSFSDGLYNLIQPKALLLGRSCEIAESYLMNCAEEVIRSQNTYALSRLIDALFPMMRETAHIGCWKIVSRGKGTGTGRVKATGSLPSLHDRQDEGSHIMVVDAIDGTEDIPPWVSAIITKSDVDILSHIAIRCRDSKVLLSTCYEQDVFERLKSYDGATLTVVIENDRIHYREHGMDDAGTTIHQQQAMRGRNRRSKSGNLLDIHDKVSAFIKTPLSATVPFEAFERVLLGNPEAFSLFTKLTDALASHPQDYPSILSDIRTLIQDLSVPSDVVQSIRERITSQGCMAVQWSGPFQEAIISTIKRVWGSVWNERAYLSRFHRNHGSNGICMGILIQNVIPADYSFIIHTRNPLSDNGDEILSEIVVGLGETLTGNAPGTPLCVVSDKRRKDHTIVSYPSKPIAYLDSHRENSFIVRSDSNDEDLPDFSGAGLYDSHLIYKPTRAFVRYDQERLFWDRDFQQVMFDSLIRIAGEIEDIMQSPQDIEGVYAGDSFYVVQTRNQVG